MTNKEFRVTYFQATGPQIFHKSRNHLNILGAIRVTWYKLHTEDLQILGAITKFSHPGDVTPGICAPLV
jgi:hypothetical protein